MILSKNLRRKNGTFAGKISRKSSIFDIRNSGMTLIEVLVAISIASLLAVAGYRAMASLTSSASLLTETAQRWQTLEATFESVERAYRGAVPGGGLVLTNGQLTTRDLTGQTQLFGRADDTIASWTIAAWDGNSWVEQWRANEPPRALKVSVTTTPGLVLERRFAK